MENNANLKCLFIAPIEFLYSIIAKTWFYVLTVGALLLLIGVLLGYGLIVSLSLGLLLLTACFLLCKKAFKNNAMPIFGVIALGARFFIAFIFNHIFTSFGVDSLEYHYMAKGITELMNAGVNYTAVPLAKQYFPNFIAILYYAFGINRLAATFIVNFFCVVAGVFVYLFCRTAELDKPGYFAALGVWFMPGFLFFTSDLLKDSSVLMLTALSFYLFALIVGREQKGYGVKLALVVALAAVTALNSALRFYVFAPIIIGFGLGLTVYFLRKRALRDKILTVLFILGFCVLFYVLANRYLSRYLNLNIDKLFQYINNEREWAFAYASAGIKGYDISTLPKALKALPALCAHYLLQPFPNTWLSRNGELYIKLLIPDMLTWYAMLPFAVWGGYHAVFKKKNIAVIAALGYLIVFLCVNALLVGNVGAIYRYRLQFQEMAFVLAGIGVYSAWLKRKSFFNNFKKT